MPKRASEVSTNTKDPQQGAASNRSSTPEAASMPAGNDTVDPVYIGPPMSRLHMMKMTAGLYGATVQPDIVSAHGQSLGPDFDTSVNEKYTRREPRAPRDESRPYFNFEKPKKLKE